MADWLSVWPVKSGNPLMVKVWSYLPYAVVWITWKFRNDKVFNEGMSDIHKMEQEVKGIIWYWCGNWLGRKQYHFRALIDDWGG
ncbi:hypothetical protein FRX31_013390, partial [Thalictrum thalictroides]